MVERATYERTEREGAFFSVPPPLRVTRVGPQAPAYALYITPLSQISRVELSSCRVCSQ